MATQLASAQLTHRTTRHFEMREASFGKDTDAAINTYLHRTIEAREKQLDVLFKKKVPEWRRISSGKPREESKSWPFPNCSNLVHPIVGQTCDDLAARVMGLLYATSPLCYYRYFTKAANEDEAHHNSEKARVLEQFIDYAGYEPNELDLYGIENLWFSDSAKLGTAWVCVRPEKRLEAVYLGYKDNKTEMENATLYEGPRVQNLRFEDVGYDPNANTPEESDLIWRKVTLSKRDLHERVFKKQYKKEAVETILARPDRYGPSELKKRENQKKGVIATDERVLAEWDIHECYFAWYNGDKKYRLIVWYHWESKTVLNQVFNFIPDNQLPLVRTRLAHDSHGMLGTGYAEMLHHFQEEISTAKNQRNDSITFGILGVNRISPQNKNIDKNFVLFPGANAPFGKDEFEHYNVGDAAMSGLSLQNEQAMIGQAMERAGVGPAVAGMGAGSTDKKGKFGSMGTLAVMQDSNSRMAHRLSDFRHSHVKLIGLLTDFYGMMGLGRKGSLFGLDDELLDEAFTDFLERKVRIPIRAATASANKEVTKQNELILRQAIAMHTKEISQMIQAAQQQGLPQEYIKWLRATIKGNVRLMQTIVRDFQLSDQPEEYIPNVEFADEKAPTGQPPVAETVPQPGGGPAIVRPGGVPPVAGGVPGQGGGPLG